MNIATVTKKYQDGIWNKFYTVTLTDSTDIMSVPHDTENRHYKEILLWVAAGNTITDLGE